MKNFRPTSPPSADICVLEVQYAPARVEWLTRPTPAPYPFAEITPDEARAEHEAQHPVADDPPADPLAVEVLAASFDPPSDPEPCPRRDPRRPPFRPIRPMRL